MKSKTQQKSTNTFSHVTPPETAAQRAFDEHVRTAYDTPDPTIPYTFANMRENVSNRLDNPFGHNYSPEVAEAMRYSQIGMIDQAQGQANREDAYNRRMAKTQGLAASAQMRAPQLVQTGGTSTTTHNPGMGNIIMQGISAGASLGSAALT